MSGLSRLRWSAELEMVLGPERLDSLNATVSAYTCIVCGRPGHTWPVAANVLLYVPHDPDEPSSIEFAHPSCASPQIVTVTGRVPSAPPADGPPIWISTWLIAEPGGHETRASIVLDSASDIQVLSQDATRTDVGLAILRELGWKQIRALDAQYPDVETCQVVLLPGRTGYVTAPGTGGGILVPELRITDPVWIAVAHRHASVDVLACRIGMATIAPANRENALRAEIHTGLVLAARLPLASPPMRR
ncbi:hypothetical protein [Mycobacteroides abscessus]|uniref:hypothetical protein n=1 Tax=Mycobacteroides abscessus TaxID=36809 RepID=UPI0009280726|nr:hypothetical protein [Mycobacteroides abscessus]SIC20362.1 Uncharacterised protein [Mycobacteroides abscessus subsp. abscessus]